MPTPVITRNGQSAPLTVTDMDSNLVTLATAIDDTTANHGAAIAAIQVSQASGVIGKTTLALLNADLAYAANKLAIVTNDATSSNNTYYIKLGASGSGSWQKATIPAGPRFVSASQYASFATAVTAQGSTPATLVVSGVMAVAANLTVPGTIAVSVLQGGRLEPASGVTLTMPIPTAGMYQIFGGAGIVKFTGAGAAVPEWWGAAIDTAVDSAPAVLAAASSNARRVNLDDGTYQFSTPVSVTLDSGLLEIVGSGNTVLDGTTMAGATTMLYVGGSNGATAALLADVVEGSTLLTTSLTLVKGNVIKLESTDLWADVPANGSPTGEPRNYIKGEFCEIYRVVDATTYVLTAPLFDSYTAATTTVIKKNMPSVRLKGFATIRDPSVNYRNNFGIRISKCRDVKLSDMRSEYHSHTDVQLEEVFNGSVQNLKTRGRRTTPGDGVEPPAQPNCYGLAITSCQRLRVAGGDFHGGRHAITHGGEVPNRDIVIDGATLDNECAVDDTSAPSCLDSHGNTQGLRVVNCDIKSAAWLGGIDIAVVNNTITCRNTALRRDALKLVPIRSGSYVRATGNHIKTYATSEPGFPLDTSDINYGINFVPFTNVDLTINTVKLEGNTIDTAYGTGICFATNTTGGRLTINNLVASRNIVDAYGSGSYGMYIQGGTSGLTIDKVIISGGSYYSAVSRALSVHATNTTINSIRVGGHAFFATGATTAAYVVFIEGGQSVAVQDGTFREATANACTGLYLKTTGSCIVKHNTFESSLATSFAFGSVPSELIPEGNIDNSTLGSGTMSGNISALIQNGPTVYRKQRVVFVTAKPTTGTWGQGDVAVMANAAVGTAAGWPCVTKGTFGSYTDATGSADGSTGVITNMTSTTGLTAGQYVSISAGFATTGPFRVRKVNSSSSITVDANSTGGTTTYNVTVAHVAPVFGAWPNVASS